MRYVVCCLKRSEVHLFLTRGQLPDCANSNRNATNSGNHPHIELRKAFSMVGADDGHSEAIWIGSGCRMMYQHPPRVWKGKDSRTYRNNEPHSAVRVMQMVEIRGRRAASAL